VLQDALYLLESLVADFALQAHKPCALHTLLSDQIRRTRRTYVSRWWQISRGRRFVDPEEISAFCQVFGITIPQDAPYLLEPLVADFLGQALHVRLALLTAAAKLFFARPPECQGLLGSALAAAAADTDQDVHDRGLLYYR